jgi:hypothetical protein
MGWYARGIPNAAAFREVINNTMDETVVFDALERFLGADAQSEAA